VHLTTMDRACPRRSRPIKQRPIVVRRMPRDLFWRVREPVAACRGRLSPHRGGNPATPRPIASVHRRRPGWSSIKRHRSARTTCQPGDETSVGCLSG
jgi:hypothetical protein